MMRYLFVLEAMCCCTRPQLTKLFAKVQR